MTGITVRSSDLSTITGEDITDEQFVALDRVVRGLIASVYPGDLDAASGRRQAVLDAVYTSAMVRLISNPFGARSVSLSSGGITFGGSDEAISNAFSLTAAERADLISLRPRRRSYVVLGGAR